MAEAQKLFFDALTGFYDLWEARALDMFARNGQLTVVELRRQGRIRRRLGAERRARWGR